MNNAAGQALALSAAEQAVVLLANNAGVLPFNSTVRQIAVVGPLANNTAVMMGGKTDYCPEVCPTLPRTPHPAPRAFIRCGTP